MSSANCKITSLFDSKIASRLVRKYSNDHGLSALCQEFAGVRLEKKMASSDWAKDISEYSEKEKNIYILGAGSNTLFRDSGFDGIIINAAAFTHTSIAIRDALDVFKKPIIELHISNIYKREEFRHKSLISGVVTAGIFGFGINGYILAINAMQEFLKNGNW